MTTQTSFFDRVSQRLRDNPSSFVGQMLRMRVTVTSRDKSVIGRYAVEDGTTISFDADRLRGHDENSLAAAIVEVVNGVNTGYRQATASVGRTRGEAAGLPDPKEEKRRAQYHQRIDALVVRTDSPAGYVKVRFSGHGATELKIRPGTLARVNHGDLADEVNDALTDAATRFARHKRSVHEDIFRL